MTPTPFQTDLLSDLSDLQPNYAFDFFLLPMPQAGNSKIVFASNRDGNVQIYSMNTDGSGLARLTINSSNDDHPRWSPNGTKILFQSDRDSTAPDPENPGPTKRDIYVMNVDGTGQTRLTTDSADDCNAEWSPDGSKIVFQTLRNGSYYQVYTMNPDGTGQTNLSNSSAADVQPSWAPNGTKIAFASERDHAGLPGIYVMNSNGSNQTRLTFTGEPFKDEQPIWSRDALKIAFVSTRDSVIETWQETDDDGNVIQKSALRLNKEIYLMNADGSNQTRLTNTLENEDAPAWLPDNTKIIFHSDRERDTSDPTQQLWTMNSDGTNQGLVGGNEFRDYSPSWSSTVANQSPIANPGGPYSGVIAQNIAFSANGSFDSDGTISSYSWTFGDGGSGSGVTPTHSYASTGTYNVSLTVTDNLGAQSSANTSATVTTAGSDQYVASFNLAALARQPYPNESSYWNDILRAAYPNGQSPMLLAVRELGRTLFESSDYVARGRDNYWYVYDLYRTYLMREPDAPGWAYWEWRLNTQGSEHISREQLRGAFDECGEFAGIVATLTPSGSPSSSVSSLSSARVDPFNQPGNGLASRDAEWSVSLLSLPGRAGLDLGLSLSYSSMVWTHSGPYIYFDEDNGWPSPGFRLGFPTIQAKVFDAQAGRNVYLLVSGGNRVSLRQVGTSSIYEAADSSYLQLIDYGGNLLVRTTDGRQLNYQAFNNEWRCTQIKDRNGNYITVNYDWLGHITTIVDTVGRTITFNYDSNANLTSITQLWTVNGAQTTHTWASFSWTTKTIQPSFSGVMVVGATPSTIPVISQVGLDDGTYYTFEYNWAGQANPLRSFRSDNVQRAYISYDYDLPADDCPRLIDTHTWAENWTGINGVPQEAAINYGAPGDGSHTLSTPDGTLYKEFYGTGWQRGLITQTEVWSGGVRQKWTTTDWAQDNTGVSYQTNPRVTETNVYDLGGNHRRATTSYSNFILPSGASCPLSTDTREYAADATSVLRRSHTDYRMDQAIDSAYLDRHIIGLVKEQSIYEVNGQSETLMSRVGLQYDETGSIQGTDAPVQHDNDNYAANLVAGRANLSSVKRYDVVDTSQSTISTVKYNTAGAVVDAADPLSHHTGVTYADSFSDGNNSRNTKAFATTLTDADGYSSTVVYNFDYGAVTTKQTPQPNTTQNLPGPTQTFAYDVARRLERVTAQANGAYTRYVYGPNYVQQFSTVNVVADEAYSMQTFDGMGRTILAASNHPNSTSGYSGVSTIFDSMGRIAKQSNPTEVTGGWSPAGDDDPGNGGNGWVYTQQTYDWKGRPRVTTNPSITGNPNDITTKEASYNGCGCAGGEVATLTDEGTIDGGIGRRRQQKIYADVLGRTVKTEVLNWQDGTVYSTTVNSYNARDQIKLVRQWAGAENGGGAYQDTNITYDGYGRLQSKHAPQHDANTATVYQYNADDKVQSVTDARGASQTFSYNARHLVTGVTYGTPDAYNVPQPGPLTLAYDAAGNRTAMSDDSGNTAYQYNALSQMSAETHAFNGLYTSYTLSYEYNLAGELKKITDATNVSINYGYDSAGRMNNITGSDTLYGATSQYASSMQYRAWGGLKGLTYGNGYTLAIGYNSRLMGTDFQIAGRPAQYGPSLVMKTQYQYYPDGSLKFAHDLLNQRFDRAYSYDPVSTLKEAYSGSEASDYANGGNSGTATGSYRESYQHDVFGNQTSQTYRYWSHNDSFGANYANNRRQGFTYDADGRLLHDELLQYYHDAAGNLHLTFDASLNKWLTTTYDGNGQQVKRVVTYLHPIETTYYLRSTVLGGRIVAELDQNGQKQIGYVFAGSQLLAKQKDNAVTWQLRNPLTGSFGEALANGAFTPISEPDPTGINLGLSDPFREPFAEPPDSDRRIPRLLGNRGSCGFNPNCTTCYVDGFEMGCDRVAQMADAGVLAFDVTLRNGRHVQLPIQSYGVGLFGVWVPKSYVDQPGIHPGADPITGEPMDVASATFTEGHWENFSFDFSPEDRSYHHSYDPQKTQVTTVDPDGIRNALDTMLRSGECGKFVEDLIKQLAADTKNPFVSDYALDLFDAVAGAPKGGFVRGGLADKNRVGATVSGQINSGDAAIHLNSHFELSLEDPKGRTEVLNALDAFQTLHELVHHAGSKGYYYDGQVAQAAFAMTGMPGLPDRKDYKSRKDFEGASSAYFSEVLRTKCPVLSVISK